MNRVVEKAWLEAYRRRVAEHRATAIDHVIRAFGFFGGEDDPGLRRALDEEPLILLLSPTMDMRDLSVSEVEGYLNRIDLGDAHATAYARGAWLERVALYGSMDDREGLLRQALVHLRSVPEAMRDANWAALVASCAEVVEMDAYAESLMAAIAAAEPEWRAGPVQDLLREHARKEQWEAYDVARTQWTALPQNAHICDCARHEVANMDAARAIAADRLDQAALALDAATDVRGCPHLNSGGFRLGAVRRAIEKGVSRAGCLAYLAVAKSFAMDDDEQHAKIAELEALARA